MVTSTVPVAKPSPIQASILRQQSVRTPAFASPLTAATIVSPKAQPHNSLLPLHLTASAFAAPRQHVMTAATMQPQHHLAYSHSASAPSLPALLLAANNSAAAASILSSSLPSSLHSPGLTLSFTPSATGGSLNCMPLPSAFDLSSSICRSKQRLARKAELARQSRKRKKSSVAHMADTIRQLKDDNARLRQRLAKLGVHDDSNSHGGGSSSRSKRKSSSYQSEVRVKQHHGDAKLKRQQEAELSEAEEQQRQQDEEAAAAEDDECLSELTNSSEDEDSDEVLPGAAELAALSPSSTPSSVASSLLSAASSLDLPLTALVGKRGRA